MSVDSLKNSKPLTAQAAGASPRSIVSPSPSASAENSAKTGKTASAHGLTANQARRRLDKIGPNSVPDTTEHPLQSALAKFWAPVPWMLEAAIIFQIFLGEYVEAAIIAVLLVFNAALGFFQESRAQATLPALKFRLALTASVFRDGTWIKVAAAQLVRGDLLKLSLGSVVAADVRLVDGEILLDQSMLTGESLPIEAGPGLQTYAGALVQRGEASAEVTATGSRTKFGKTAELVRTAHVVIAGTLAGALIFAFLADGLKVPVFRRLQII